MTGGGAKTPPLAFLALSWGPMNRPKPALRVELLFYLTFLAAFAILVGVATSQLALSIAPERGVFLVVVFVAAEVGIFVLYGGSLVRRLVLRPLARVMETADAVADGDLAARAPDEDTRDFATLAERLNRMTDRLLDAQSQLVRSEKLASVGRLASGIAHEVGNPLGASGTYLEVLRRRGADPEVGAGPRGYGHRGAGRLRAGGGTGRAQTGARRLGDRARRTSGPGTRPPDGAVARELDVECGGR